MGLAKSEQAARRRCVVEWQVATPRVVGGRQVSVFPGQVARLVGLPGASALGSTGGFEVAKSARRTFVARGDKTT